MIIFNHLYKKYTLIKRIQLIYHYHPYKPILNFETRSLIIGTLPPPRFSIKELKPKDVDFPYGSCDNLLWQIIDKIYKLDLLFDNSPMAVIQREKFLIDNNIGICDIVESCQRERFDASDLAMKNVILRDILYYLETYKNIDKIIFTGGSSKNSPQYFLKKILKQNDIKFIVKEKNNPKIHQFIFDNRVFTTYSLISPSNAANKSIGANILFKQKKENNPRYTTFDFRIEEYEKVFKSLE
jgi:G:T/U-mismatch repair DNA glycosylase